MPYYTAENETLIQENKKNAAFSRTIIVDINYTKGNACPKYKCKLYIFIFLILIKNSYNIWNIRLISNIIVYSCSELLKRTDTRMYVRAIFSKICGGKNTFQRDTCKTDIFGTIWQRFLKIICFCIAISAHNFAQNVIKLNFDCAKKFTLGRYLLTVYIICLLLNRPVLQYHKSVCKTL